jgi:hypothetical protein
MCHKDALWCKVTWFGKVAFLHLRGLGDESNRKCPYSGTDTFVWGTRKKAGVSYKGERNERTKH